MAIPELSTLTVKGVLHAIKDAAARQEIEVLDEKISSEHAKSAYDIAVENGFEGTEAEWLASLKGSNVDTSLFANAIKKTVSAVNVLDITDVSPVAHIIKARVICPEGVTPLTVTALKDCDHGVQTFDPHADGTLDDIQSCGCTAISFWAGEGITIEVEYNQDASIAMSNIETQTGDISTALDELHTYAQTLVEVGVTE